MSRRPRRNHSAAFKAKVAVEALRDGKTVALRSAYQAADSGLLGLEQTQLSAEEVDQAYRTVRTALPKAPLRFTLFFEAGGQVLTAESQQRIAELRSALASYAAPELLVRLRQLPFSFEQEFACTS